MSDTKDTAAENRRTVVVTDPHEHRHYIDQFVKDNPRFQRDEVEEALDRAADEIAPSKDRKKLATVMLDILVG